MFRLLRSLAIVALAFWAGVMFERADAQEACIAEEQWGTWLSCVSREVLEEVI